MITREQYFETRDGLQKLVQERQQVYPRGLEVCAERIDLLRQAGSLSPWQRFQATALLREISWKGSTKERGAQWTALIGPLMDRVVAELHELLILADRKE